MIENEFNNREDDKVISGGNNIANHCNVKTINTDNSMEHDNYNRL